MRFFILAWLYILAAFGFAFIVGYAKISLPLRAALAMAERESRGPRGERIVWELPLVEPRRWLLDLLQCPACLGFWIGGAFALADPGLFGAVVALGLDRLPMIVLVPIFGLATSASNFILGALTGLIEVH